MGEPVSTLTAKAVETAFMNCLFTEEELKEGQPKEFVQVDAITCHFGFHPGRLESHREEVKALLAELPDQFHAGKGGGWSFLNACMDRHGNQWGEHIHMEQLFALGIGLNLAKWQFPRKMWRALPGGMPYVVVNLEGLK
jgi:hypothetical protein